MTGYQLVKFLLPAKYDAYQASTSDMPLSVRPKSTSTTPKPKPSWAR